MIFRNSYYIIALLSVSGMLQIIFPAQIRGQSVNEFTEKGTFEVGGTISYQHTDLMSRGKEYQSFSLFSFLPYAGYFIVEGLEIGINPLGIQTYWDSEDKITSMTILLAPSYNFKMEGGVYPFIEVQLGYTSEIYSGAIADMNPEKTKRNGFSWGIRTGAKVAVVGNCLLNAGLQFQQIALNPDDETERSGSNIIMFSAGFTFWL